MKLELSQKLAMVIRPAGEARSTRSLTHNPLVGWYRLAAGTEKHSLRFWAAFKITMASLVLGCGVYLPAVVSTQTTISNLRLGGTAERAGLISVWVTGDDFVAASPDQPVYLRLHLDFGARLSETLAAPGQQPALIPLRLAGGDSGERISAPSDTVSVVRWVAGESQVWLKINYSSSFWVNRGGSLGPPSVVVPVVWILGETLEESRSRYEADHAANRANLPQSQRADGSALGLPLTLDVSQSSLMAAPRPPSQSLLTFDMVAYDFRTERVETAPNAAAITPGNILPIIINGDREIGRGTGSRIDRWLSHITAQDANFRTDLHFRNHGNMPQNVTLVPFDGAGNRLQNQFVNLRPADTRVLQATAVFSGDPVSHVQILADELVTVSLSYQPVNGQGWPVAVHEGVNRLRTWQIYPGDARFGTDVMAVVNHGDEAAQLTVRYLDEGGVILAEEVYFGEGGFTPLSKKTLVLSQPEIPNQPVLIEFQSTQQVSLVQLRASLPGSEPVLLVPVVPVPRL